MVGSQSWVGREGVDLGGGVGRDEYNQNTYKILKELFI